jgi:hypothetical protein
VKKPYVIYNNNPAAKKDNYKMWDTKEFSERKEGIFCGTRTINYKGATFSGYAGSFVDDAEPPKFKSLEKREVYLIAINTRGFCRVLEEWLEKGDNSS